MKIHSPQFPQQITPTDKRMWSFSRQYHQPTELQSVYFMEVLFPGWVYPSKIEKLPADLISSPRVFPQQSISLSTGFISPTDYSFPILSLFLRFLRITDKISLPSEVATIPRELLQNLGLDQISFKLILSRRVGIHIWNSVRQCFENLSISSIPNHGT